MSFRNKELIDKRLSQLDGKLKAFRFLLNRQGSKEDFNKVLTDSENILEDLTALIERESSPMRNG
tara:strand:- start:812 stop:1006 length:195 start_codon:yes stop_codon:yes gene_type:complete